MVCTITVFNPFLSLILLSRAFLLQVPLTFLALISVSLALKLPTRETGHFKDRVKRIDFLGALTLVIALVALLLGLDRGANSGWAEKSTIASLIIFAVFFPAFLFVEIKVAKEPFAPKRIVANKVLLATYLCNFLTIAAQVCAIFYISLYVQAVERKSAAQAGASLLPSIAASVTGSLLSGYIVQVTGRYRLLTILLFFWTTGGQLLITLFSGVLVHSYLGIELCKNYDTLP
jgi:hypothetical protein